jgi:hypothetical protein
MIMVHAPMHRILFTGIILLLFLPLRSQEYQDPDITRVLVNPEDNQVHVYFTGTDHPDVSYYKISQWQITGNNPIASGVPIELSRVDHHDGIVEYHKELDIPEVENEPVGFTVGAFNASGEVLLESYPPDSTIHLTVEYDSCEASARLYWNDYNAWRGHIQEYEIMGQNSDSTFNFLMKLPEEIRDTILYGLQADNLYHFFIIARHDRLFNNSYVTSNGVFFDTEHSFYPEFIHADFGTVSEANRPHIHFTIDPRSELDTFQVLRSENPGSQFEVINYDNPDNNIVEYTDGEVDASIRPYYYKLVAINYCHQAIGASENVAGTIYLEAQNEGYNVNLNWTDYFNWNTGVDRFDIERRFPDEDFQIIYSTLDLSFVDQSLNNLINQQTSSEVFYRITAHELAGDPYSSQPALSSSNIVRVFLPTNVRFEYNAFVPGLESFDRFGPTIDFLPTEAKFTIFNRWGNVVFETRDVYNLLWDGHQGGGDYAPEGVYRYQFEYRDESGNWTVINGNVTVVRQ